MCVAKREYKRKFHYTTLCCKIIKGEGSSGRGIPPLLLFLMVSSIFLPVKGFLGEFFLIRINGLRTEGVVHCTDCTATCDKLWFVILGYINKIDLTWNWLGPRYYRISQNFDTREGKIMRWLVCYRVSLLLSLYEPSTNLLCCLCLIGSCELLWSVVVDNCVDSSLKAIGSRLAASLLHFLQAFLSLLPSSQYAADWYHSYYIVNAMCILWRLAALSFVGM